MEYFLNKQKTKSVETGNDGTWFKFKTLWNYTLSIDMPSRMELNKISDKYIYKNGVLGRKSLTAIESNGIAEWINHSIRFTPHEKREFIKELIDQNLISKNYIISISTKETRFFSELQDFITEYNPALKLQRQLCVSEGIVVDGLIDNTVIEFDENKHISYDYYKEEERECKIRKSGYNLIRVSDKESIGYSIGVVLRIIEQQRSC